MRVSFASLIVPLLGAAASAVLVGLTTWEDLRTALLPAMSIIAAAVLVRLARGLPFTNADHFTLEQFRTISTDLEDNARKLRALIFVCLTAIVFLVLAKEVSNLVEMFAKSYLTIIEITDRLFSALIGFTLTYSFVRIVEVVHSDVALLRAQSNILEKAIARKNAKAFEDAVSKEPGPGIAGSAKFGTRIPH